ncbi:MAG: GNAT family N-acetyltransferase [Gammaproteobacteria bacterium]|nr:GNAT family N-acetyltransferase [Gammaproteobacteria bacterium]
MTFDVRPVLLENTWVRLEPLQPRHAEALFAIGQDAGDWAYMPHGCFTSLDHTRSWIADALTLQEKGEQVSFVIIDRSSGAVAGSTRFLNIRRRDRGLEIGWTWLGRDFQRSAVNTATKLLLLQHAFDTLGALRVELKTDARNLRSQAAIARLGATREGVFRRHMIVQNGFVRDTVYFSITDQDWPRVRDGLLEKLGAANPS